MPPVLLTGATVLGDTSVSNSGDVEAYPIWTIHGPGKPTFINFRSGRQFGLNVTLGVDEIITVDTRPTMQAATDATGANRWGDLVKSSPRDLWPLLPGNNDLHLGIAASGPGTAVHLSYTRRWLRA
jgi:phage-related protein